MTSTLHDPQTESGQVSNQSLIDVNAEGFCYFIKGKQPFGQLPLLKSGSLFGVCVGAKRICVIHQLDRSGIGIALRFDGKVANGSLHSLAQTIHLRLVSITI